MDGGIRLLPNGLNDTYAELYLNDDPEEYSYIRSQFRILNNELYIDYSETPEADNSRYERNDHIYKVLHEGNNSIIITYTTTIGGFNSGYEYEIEHDLDTINVLVQCRNILTGESKVYNNKVVDENNIKIVPNESLFANQVSVIVIGIK